MQRFSRDAAAWLIAAALLGVGQQAFVVLRNPYLAALQFSPEAIATVQGSGGAAGIVAGLVGMRALRALTPRTALGLGVATSAIGFGLQVVATRYGAMVAGAALAGLGIQWLTMSAAPFLVESSTPEDRARLFAFQAIFIQALPGALGALLGGLVQNHFAHVSGSALTGFRWALAGGTVASFLALVPVRRISSAATPQARGDSMPLAGATLLVPDALLFLGNGLTTPFLQLYFGERFGLSSASIGVAYGAMMIASVGSHLVAPSAARRTGLVAVILGAQLLSLPLLGVLFVATSAWTAAPAFVARQALVATAAPQYSNWIHSTVAPRYSSSVAGYRMLAQSIAWAGGNFAAGPLL